MKTISLSQNKVALVDDADFEWLNQWKWSAYKGKGTFYAARSIYKGHKKVAQVQMHALIIGTPKGMDTDHRDGNGLNNQRLNLRICTHAQNQQNQATYTQVKSSKFKGVSQYKHTNKWCAGISICGKRKWLGYFESEIDAANAYDKAAREYYGEFARTNFNEVLTPCCERR